MIDNIESFNEPSAYHLLDYPLTLNPNTAVVLLKDLLSLTALHLLLPPLVTLISLLFRLSLTIF